MTLWEDQGPVSQGKILTALLQDDLPRARRLIHAWSAGDVRTLELAAENLMHLARTELLGRDDRAAPPPQLPRCPLERYADCPGWAGPCSVDLGRDCPDIWAAKVARQTKPIRPPSSARPRWRRWWR